MTPVNDSDALQPAPPPEPPSDGRRAKRLRSRDAALSEAVQLASVEGLEGLTIARLAERLGTVKSSLHATFGSKEALQVATLQRAREMLIELVVAPALDAHSGLTRLRALGESWFTYLADDVFEGGCLLCSASAEMDGRPGLARDAVAGVMREWLQFLADNAQIAIDQGELDATSDPAQLAFELNAIGMAANWHHQLIGGPNTFDTARATWAAALQRRQPEPEPERPKEHQR